MENQITKTTKKVYGSTEFINENGEFIYQTSPLKAIRHKCLYDCCAGEMKEVRKCKCTTCFLHPFRFGKNPFHKLSKNNVE